MLPHERNLTRSLTIRLEDGYCSITVDNCRFFWFIRFVAQSCTYLWNFFTNRFHLVLHAWKILWILFIAQTNQTGLSCLPIKRKTHNCYTGLVQCYYCGCDFIIRLYLILLISGQMVEKFSRKIFQSHPNTAIIQMASASCCRYCTSTVLAAASSSSPFAWCQQQ